VPKCETPSRRRLLVRQAPRFASNPGCTGIAKFLHAALDTRRVSASLVFYLASSVSLASGLLPEPTARAIHYQQSQDWFWCADQAMGLLVPLVALFSGLAGTVARQCRRLSGDRWFLTIVLFAIAYAGADFLVNLPLAYWEGYANEHEFGLGTGSVGQWAQGQLVEWLGRVVAVSFLTWIPYFFLKTTPRRWWLWSALAFVPVFVLIFLVSPIWIAPLTNNYEPLSNKPLAARIGVLADKAGIAGATILVKDESRTSTLPNAQVRGLFATKRIVIFDTAIDQTNERELLVIVAHEMGHYVHGDPWKFIAIQLSLVLLGFLGAHFLGAPAVRRFGTRWGFTSLSCPASLPLLYLSFNLVVLVTTPTVNAFIQSVEHNADVFALDLTQDKDAALGVIVKYAKAALYVPDPGWFRRNFRMDHPSLDDRARSLVTYQPGDEKPRVQ
jgi:STE24 endopeptidase